MKQPFLEVRIPISPHQHYFNRILFIAASIRTLGGLYADTRIKVCVGADTEPYDIRTVAPWSEQWGVEWDWVDRQSFNVWKNTPHPYIATMMQRFSPPYTADYILMLDADILAIRPFDALFQVLKQHSGITGVMAHVSPFPHDQHQQGWQQLFHAANIPRLPRFDYAHTGWGVFDHHEKSRLGPHYFNTGVLLANADTYAALYTTYMEMLHLVRCNFSSYFYEQIALTLALEKTAIPPIIVPIRYNYPNYPLFDPLYPEELNQISLLHFLCSDCIQREGHFENLASILLIPKIPGLTGSNRILQQRLTDLIDLLHDNLTQIPR